MMPPGGYSAGLAEPGPRSVQETCDQGRRVTFTWFDPPFRPEPPHSNQAYGICFTETGLIVLGACDVGGAPYWNLLGGGVEPGETLEGCLIREVMEEGCARVIESRYIGCQRVDEPEHPAGPRRYYQTRFWARVELLPWDPRHEVSERRLVRPGDFLRTLAWGSAPSAAIILAEGLRVEAGRRPG
jgi:8-oxo-dGTP pyrophosphatase MutT (NUDIX family)